MDYNNKKQWRTQKRVPQYKQTSQKEKDELLKQMVAILRTRDLNDEEQEVVENAEVAIIDYETLKQRVYDCKTIEGLVDLTKKFEVTPGSYLAQYVQRRTVWLKCFNVKSGKATKESAEKLLNKYKGAFRPDDVQKVIDFLNK